MANRNVIAVFGATGAQGGSVARALLESKHFTVRALTRNVTKPAAIALRDLGAEVVRCDLDDKASVEAAFKGAYGVFLVTNFWEYLSKDKEVCQVTPDNFQRGFMPAAKPVADMFHFLQMKPDDDVKLTHCLNPKVKSFSQFISENQGAFKDLQKNQLLRQARPQDFSDPAHCCNTTFTYKMDMVECKYFHCQRISIESSLQQEILHG